MKGLKKVALASAIAAVSAGAQAELKALDDAAMGELTGQAGLTIDLETKYTIGEFMYKDAGSVYLTGISLGATTNTNDVVTAAGAQGLVDNIRIKLDIAGAGATDGVQGDFSPLLTGGAPALTDAFDNELDTGFSKVRSLAGLQTVAAAGVSNAESAKFAAAANGQASLADLQAAGVVDATGNVTDNNAAVQNLGGKKTYGDGDLLIHVSFKDAWQKIDTLGGADGVSDGGTAVLLGAGALGGLTYQQVLDSGLKSVDFNFGIDAIGLASSSFEAGDSIGDAYNTHTATGVDSDGDASTTVLISDLSVNGYLGPVDIHIENNGNGFGAGSALPTFGAADSKINWNTYVNVTDLDVYLDIAGVRIDDLKINNVRGDVTDLNGEFSFGFAQSQRQIYAVKDTAALSGTALLGIAGGTIAVGSVVDVLNAAGEDGVAINTVFKGDMEIGALSFGDTNKSIGELYWTDIESTTNWTISAH